MLHEYIGANLRYKPILAPEKYNIEMNSPREANVTYTPKLDWSNMNINRIFTTPHVSKVRFYYLIFQDRKTNILYSYNCEIDIDDFGKVACSKRGEIKETNQTSKYQSIVIGGKNYFAYSVERKITVINSTCDV